MEIEQKVKYLENEVEYLKNELKRTRKANIWKKVKDKFANEFNSFNWIYVRHTINCDEEPIVFKDNMNESYHVQQAIGTIVRITLKRKGLNYLEEKDIEKAEKITKEILAVMKREEENQ